MGGVIPWVVVIAACLVSAVLDIRDRRIPNWVTLPVLAGGLVWGFAQRHGAGLGDAAGGCLLLAAPFLVMFIFAGGGAGDVKLMAAVGAWLGINNGIVALICVLLAGGILGLLFAFYRRQVLNVFRNLAHLVLGVYIAAVGRRSWRDMFGAAPEVRTMQTMPYGVAILAGVCVAAGGVLWLRGL